MVLLELGNPDLACLGEYSKFVKFLVEQVVQRDVGFVKEDLQFVHGIVKRIGLVEDLEDKLDQAVFKLRLFGAEECDY